MLASLRCFFLALLGAVLFAGCCANDSCACEDSRADALYLRFRSSGPGAFQPADVDSVVLLRYPLPLSPTAPHDSILLIRTADRAGTDIVLNNNAPFAQAGTRKLDSYAYLVQLVRRSTAGALRVTQTFTLRDIVLRGRFEGDGCCTCYRNSHKSVVVDGKPQDVSETGKQPVPIVLDKR